MIKVGDKLPAATFRTIQDGKMVPQTTDEIFNGKRVVLVGVPGAFTPTCHKNHVPGYVKQAAEIRARNVDTIAVTAVNDQHIDPVAARPVSDLGRVAAVVGVDDGELGPAFQRVGQ